MHPSTGGGKATPPACSGALGGAESQCRKPSPQHLHLGIRRSCTCECDVGIGTGTVHVSRKRQQQAAAPERWSLMGCFRPPLEEGTKQPTSGLEQDLGRKGSLISTYGSGSGTRAIGGIPRPCRGCGVLCCAVHCCGVLGWGVVMESRV